MKFIMNAVLPILAWLLAPGAFAYDLPVKNEGALPLHRLMITDHLGNTVAMDLPTDSHKHIADMGGSAAPGAMLTFTLNYCAPGQEQDGCALPAYARMSRVEWEAGCTLGVSLQTIPVGSPEQQQVRHALITGMTCPEAWRNGRSAQERWGGPG